MNIKDRLHELVDLLDGDESPEEAIEYLSWLLSAEAETLTDVEHAAVRKGEDQLRKGESITLAELKHKLGH
jgi:hypothetical protein